MEREEPRTRMVPDLKDIRTYLMLDMMPVMTAGIQEALDSGRLAEITQSPLVSEAVHPAMVKIKKVSCYLEDRNDFFADVQVMLTLHAKDEDGNVYVIICGAFFLCSAPPDSENFESLTEEQMERYTKLFQRPELFLRVNGEIVAVPV